MQSIGQCSIVICATQPATRFTFRLYTLVKAQEASAQGSENNWVSDTSRLRHEKVRVL